MATPFDAAVTLVEQLSPVDQARLVALLAERLQHTLRGATPLPDEDAPAFWHIPVADTEWPAGEGAPVEQYRDGDSARAETQAMLTRWFGTQLREEEALDLAMSETIAEWNLHE